MNDKVSEIVASLLKCNSLFFTIIFPFLVHPFLPVWESVASRILEIADSYEQETKDPKQSAQPAAEVET